MRIWFNHWFSTAYYYIESLKNTGHTLLCTNKKVDCVYSIIADEFFVEPEDDIGYVDWCLNFCEKHDINVFFPYRGMSEISERLADFMSLGVRVICEREFITKLFDDKYKSGLYLKDAGICSIPECKLITTVDDFISAYNYMSGKYLDLCIKYNTDKGGQSFKRIRSKNPSINRLIENDGISYSYEYLLDCLYTERFKPLLLMPYIDGIEVSIDCLYRQDGMFICVPRYKQKRFTDFRQSDEFKNLIVKLGHLCNFDYPFNVQFRFDGKSWLFIDLNTRLSGGAWKDKILGIDFVDIIINNGIFPSIDFESRRLYNLEGVV